MRTEQRIWQWIKRGSVRTGVLAYRVENQVLSGDPDVNIITKDGVYFLELKIFSGAKYLKARIEKSQVIWHTKIAKVNPRAAWFLADYNNELWLINCREVRKISTTAVNDIESIGHFVEDFEHLLGLLKNAAISAD